MSRRVPGCPECGEAASFDLLSLSARQEGAVYAFAADGSPRIESAGSVVVHEYDPDDLMCTACGAEVREDDLVAVGAP